MKSASLSWRINDQIRSDKLRVLGSDGKQIGILGKKEALDESKRQGLDLVEIAPLASPPVAKIVNFGKFRYQEEKKRREELKRAKKAELKEVRFTPFIADNDYQTRLERVKEFIAEKNKVKLVVVFKGRQMGSKQFGYNVLKKVLAQMGDEVAVDVEPKFIGRYLMMTISPLGRTKQKNAETKN